MTEANEHTQPTDYVVIVSSVEQHSFSYLGCYTILSRVLRAIQWVFGTFYLLRKDSNTLFFNLEITLLLYESFRLFG